MPLMLLFLILYLFCKRACNILAPLFRVTNHYQDKDDV